MTQTSLPSSSPSPSSPNGRDVRQASAAETVEIVVNGKTVTAAPSSLADLLRALDYDGGTVATAVNGEFVAAAQREAYIVKARDQIEILSPRQGG